MIEHRRHFFAISNRNPQRNFLHLFKNGKFEMRMNNFLTPSWYSFGIWNRERVPMLPKSCNTISRQRYVCICQISLLQRRPLLRNKRIYPCTFYRKLQTPYQLQPFCQIYKSFCKSLSALSAMKIERHFDFRRYMIWSSSLFFYHSDTSHMLVRVYLEDRGNEGISFYDKLVIRLTVKTFQIFEWMG